MIPTKYSGTQAELYLACRFGFELCETNLSAFTAYKSKYTPAFIAQNLAAIDAADALDDSTARYTTAQNLRLDVIEQRDEFMFLYNALRGYIADAYRGDKGTNMAKSAGHTFYAKANANNWASATALMSAAVPFALTYKAELMANENMPADFPTRLQAKKADFDAVYKAWNAADTASTTQTQEKIAANNAIYTSFSAMVSDASKAFRPTDPTLEKFSIVNIYAQIRGSKPSGLNGLITDEATKEPREHAKVSIPLFGKIFTTKEDGRFDFTPLPVGKYDLQIECEGYETVFKEEVEVGTGAVTRLNVKMVAVKSAVEVVAMT
jgi:hypothetical protein